MSDEKPVEAERPAVLLIDDEQPLLDALRLNLEADFEIETAGSAQEAEMHLALRRFDVIVSDHLMPDESGLDFLVRMSERYPETRRILMTGYMNPELISRATVVASLSGCLLKPIHHREVSSLIHAALGPAQRG